MVINKIIIISEVGKMRKVRKITLEELILENKRKLLNDREAMEKIEEKLEERILKKME
jgi:hypothetical protein